jgi:hypothetical protein
MKKRGKKLAVPVRPDEIIRVVFNPQKGAWIAVPGLVVLAPGRWVEWRALRCNRFDFIPDPAAFENVGPGSRPMSLLARVRSDALGYYICAMKADNNPVEGGSSPAVIVD